MKNRLKRLLNNKGLTLAELIIVMFITAVIISVAMGLVIPVRDMMSSMKSNAHMDTVSSTVNEYVRGTVQTANALTFIQLEGNNNIKDADRDAVKKFFSDHPGKVKAMAVLNTVDDTDAPVYRLFDFESVPGNTELINLIGARDEAAYGVFRNTFYGDTANQRYSCAMELFNNESGKWLQVASQCWKVNDEGLDFVNQKHVLNFKLLNTAMESFGGIAGDGEETAAGIEEQLNIEGHCYLILYATL